MKRARNLAHIAPLSTRLSVHSARRPRTRDHAIPATARATALFALLPSVSRPPPSYPSPPPLASVLVLIHRSPLAGCIFFPLMGGFHTACATGLYARLVSQCAVTAGMSAVAVGDYDVVGCAVVMSTHQRRWGTGGGRGGRTIEKGGRRGRRGTLGDGRSKETSI